MSGYLTDAREGYVCEETGDEVVFIKDTSGRLIGFEKLNFSEPDPEMLRVAFETASA
ncbi:MAG: DUF2283 domain-containing protein [Acidobacteria bacterium]|nr:DUF2283 domain-containing protein [Acidobacteriota bacterium]